MKMVGPFELGKVHCADACAGFLALPAGSVRCFSRAVA